MTHSEFSGGTTDATAVDPNKVESLVAQLTERTWELITNNHLQRYEIWSPDRVLFAFLRFGALTEERPRLARMLRALIRIDRENQAEVRQAARAARQAHQDARQTGGG